MSVKRVLVTGATGFIGRHTIPLLKNEGYEVTEFKGNLLIEKHIDWCFLEKEYTHLLHLAWNVKGDYLNSIENFNWLIHSQYLLQQFIEQGGKHAVYAGTCFDNNPYSYYGRCKHMMNESCAEYARMHGIEYAYGRIFFPYGDGEKSDRLIPYIINSLLKGEDAILTHGTQVRDYLYVKDVAEAFVEILGSHVEGDINIGSGRPVQIREVAEEIGNQMGMPEKIQLGRLIPRQNEPQYIVADTKRLNERVGWRPRYSLKWGIQETIKYWREQK